jgi:hypothetical protein
MTHHYQTLEHAKAHRSWDIADFSSPKRLVPFLEGVKKLHERNHPAVWIGEQEDEEQCSGRQVEVPRKASATTKLILGVWKDCAR